MNEHKLELYGTMDVLALCAEHHTALLPDLELQVVLQIIMVLKVHRKRFYLGENSSPTVKDLSRRAVKEIWTLWATYDLCLLCFVFFVLPLSYPLFPLNSCFLLFLTVAATGFYGKWAHCYISNKGQYVLVEYMCVCVHVCVCMENGVMSNHRERSLWRVLEWSGMTFCERLVPSELN